MMMDASKKGLPAVKFAGVGPVTVAESVIVVDCGDGVDVYVRHPSGGRVFIAHEASVQVADVLVSSLTDVLSAWARLSLEGGA